MRVLTKTSRPSLSPQVPSAQKSLEGALDCAGKRLDAKLKRWPEYVPSMPLIASGLRLDCVWIAT